MEMKKWEDVTEQEKKVWLNQSEFESMEDLQKDYEESYERIEDQKAKTKVIKDTLDHLYNEAGVSAVFIGTTIEAAKEDRDIVRAVHTSISGLELHGLKTVGINEEKMFYVPDTQDAINNIFEKTGIMGVMIGHRAMNETSCFTYDHHSDMNQAEIRGTFRVFETL